MLIKQTFQKEKTEEKKQTKQYMAHYEDKKTNRTLVGINNDNWSLPNLKLSDYYENF